MNITDLIKPEQFHDILHYSAEETAQEHKERIARIALYRPALTKCFIECGPCSDRPDIEFKSILVTLALIDFALSKLEERKV